ncbi:hypothetical protein A0J61_09897 [Choanephora cucurbitarum]|uniref:F-box domain-containing protein n=1 Tax=Choanephora cucurbitarum TaxID=101091 RepID=A0A1C7MYQ5_9FUNG|nr:hypothetical protein A0J61_09897 [Choanephora cucurbitarum]
MSTLDTLPQEIYDKILDYVSPKNLSSLSLICRRLYGVAINRLYKHVSIKNSGMLEDLVTTFDNNASLGSLVRTLEIRHVRFKENDEQNLFYDNLVALILQTPSVLSVKMHYRIRELVIQAIRNTCGQGHWQHLKILELRNNQNRIQLTGLQHLPKSLDECLCNRKLILGNPAYRLEVNQVNTVVNQKPAVDTLEIFMYRLTDWNEFIQLGRPHFHITQLIVRTSWLTDTLLEYICTKCPNVRRLELKQIAHNHSTDNFIAAATLLEFASYLMHIEHFDVTFFRLKSDLNARRYFKNSLGRVNAGVIVSNSKRTLYLARPKRSLT